MRKVIIYLIAAIGFQVWGAPALGKEPVTTQSASAQKPAIKLAGREAKAFRNLMTKADVKPEPLSQPEERAYATCVTLMIEKDSYRCCAKPGIIRCFGPLK